MLNHLTQHDACVIETTTGSSIAGTYRGVETPHGDWSVLVTTDGETLSIPVTDIAAVSAA